MKYVLELTREDALQLKAYFETDPFCMQAAFLLTDICQMPGFCRITAGSIQTLRDEDYEYRTAESLSFHASAYAQALRLAGSQGRSMAFMHSRKDGEISCRRSDEAMMFRMAYAYIPFGVHASLYYQSNAIGGTVWLPGHTAAPIHMLNK